MSSAAVVTGALRVNFVFAACVQQATNPQFTDHDRFGKQSWRKTKTINWTH